MHPNRSARAHLRWLAKSNKLPTKRVDEVLEPSVSPQVANRRAGGFSLGMSQRLGIAAALLGDPQVLLFDEPVNGLDPEGILWIRTFMQRLAAEGRTVLVSSHLLSEMALTAQRARRHRPGPADRAEHHRRSSSTAGDREHRPGAQPSARSAPLGARSTRASPSATRATARCRLGMDHDQIGELAAANGVVLHELSPQRGSLEEAFMQLTGDCGRVPRRDAPAGAAASDLTAREVNQ